MKTSTLLYATFSTLALGLASESFALGFGCAGVAGEVVFLNTIYGSGTGALIAGVIEFTQESHEDWSTRLAQGATIGAGLGLALGIAEIAIRDCESPSRVNHTSRQPGALTPNLVVHVSEINLASSGDWGAGLQVRYLVP